MDYQGLLNMLLKIAQKYHPDWPEKDKKRIAIIAAEKCLQGGSFEGCCHCGETDWLIQENEDAWKCLNCGVVNYLVDCDD